MDAKNSLEANMEATDLITFIRELDLTDPDDKETKQKLIDIYAESIFSQLSESDNECMEDFKSLLGDKRVRESIVNFVTSKPPAGTTEKGTSQLPAINEESLRDIITETLTNESELMQNVQTKLDKIMRLIVVMEQNSTKSKPIKSKLSEKTPTELPFVPPQFMRLLQKASYDPFNRWRRSTGTNTDPINQLNCEPHKYGGRMPTYYRRQRHRQTTRNVNVPGEHPRGMGKPYKSRESYEICGYEEIDELYAQYLPIPQESDKDYSLQYYFDPQSAPPPPLTRTTVQFRPRVLFKPAVLYRQPISSRPPVLCKRPVSLTISPWFRPQALFRPSPRRPNVSPASYEATFHRTPPPTSRRQTRLLEQWEPTPQCEAASGVSSGEFRS